MSRGWAWYVVGLVMFGLFAFDVAGMLTGRLDVDAWTGIGMALVSGFMGLVAMIQGDVRADKGK
jgi:hypothetical protein